MAEQGKQQISEGESITRPPLFAGDDYLYWKDKMETFIKSTQYSLWKVITKGDYIPTDSEGQVINEDEWTATQLQKVQENFKAKFILSCALCKSEYDKVFICKTAKDIWEQLSSMYENRKSNGEQRNTYDVLKDRTNESINTTTTPTVEAKSEKSETYAEIIHDEIFLRNNHWCTWDNTNSNSSDESEASEEVHTALMAKTDNDSKDKPKVRKQLSRLEKVYKDLRKDSQVLITHCSNLEKINEELTFQLSEKDRMIQELSNKNLDFLKKNESLYSQGSLTESESSQPSGEVETLRQKVEELTKDLAKFVKGSENLKIIMGISRRPYDKSGLGYEENKKYDAKSHSKYSIIHNHGYPVNRYDDRKQKLQASSTNTEGPKRNWVPRKLNTSFTDKSSKWRTISETNPRATDIHIS